MPTSPNDVVRPFQIPTVTTEQAYLSQYNLASNTPIYVTPGFGAASPSGLPPIQTGTSHYDTKIAAYCTMVQSEISQPFDQALLAPS